MGLPDNHRIQGKMKRSKIKRPGGAVLGPPTSGAFNVTDLPARTGKMVCEDGWASRDRTQVYLIKKKLGVTSVPKSVDLFLFSCQHKHF